MSEAGAGAGADRVSGADLALCGALEGVSEMIRFDSDYTEGCHPKILEALAATNMEQHPGYGEDAHCARARALIRDACAVSETEADVHFLVGGTQVNCVVIIAALRPWEGVLSAESGHIACHETGAIEAAGHKVLTLPHENGKIDAHTSPLNPSV